jgi:hypothetical protein
MSEKVRTEISGELLEAVRLLAEERGREEGEVLEDAVRYFLGSYRFFTRVSERSDVDISAAVPDRPGSLEELFERIDRGQRERGVEPLSEEDAIRLADEELHAMRRARRTGR